MNTFGRMCLAALLCLSPQILGTQALADPIKVGVQTALTGDAATFGNDIKNALVLVNEKFGKGRYDLIFEDEKCNGAAAVTVANKLINLDKISYALGFPCNETLIPTAPLYERAGVLVITSSATSGDLLDLGKHIFRLFPSDSGASVLLYRFMKGRSKKLAILTEENQYPVMMERTFKRENEANGKPIEVATYSFIHGTTDLRTTLYSAISKGIDSIFLNCNTETSFITAARQVRRLKFTGTIYAVYNPGSPVVLKELGVDNEGIFFSNLPVTDELATKSGRELLGEFRKRFGEPQAGFPVVPIAFESFRLLDLMLNSGKDPIEFLQSTRFSGGFIPDYYFDSHGAVQGIEFQMQKIEGEKVVKVQVE